MAKKHRKPISAPTRGVTSTGRRLLFIGLAVFIALDIALVAVALANKTPPVNAGETAGPVSSTTPSPAPSGSPAPTAAPVEPAAPAEIPSAIAPTRIIAALDDSTAWRAQVGSCPADAATVERTTNGGADWASFDAAVDTGASRILAINALGETNASMVTLRAEDCTPQVVVTFVGGEQWADQSDRLGGNWYIDPQDATTVHSPAGSFDVACDTAVAMAARDSEKAAVVCADGNVLRTNDGGASWQPPVAVRGAANLTGTGSGYLLALTDQPECNGVQLAGIAATGGDGITPISCVEASVKPGEVALTSADEAVWLWAGEQLARSTDGGATWQ